MIVTFSHEEVELPKGTVLGMAEEVSETLVATVNDGPGVDSRKVPRQTAVDLPFREYLNDKLGHLTPEERKVIEPVLIQYRKTFYVEGSNEFKGTDLIQHRIDTGDAKPIRRPPYRVPYALREEMNRQVEDMPVKGVIEASTSPWQFSAILVPKRSLESKPKYRFCVDLRALGQITRFDAYALPLFDETMSTVHGSKYFSTLD
jgi:hypothetical protein